MCLFFNQQHVLQQLLHYHVLLDSVEIAYRLFEVHAYSICPKTYNDNFLFVIYFLNVLRCC